MLSTRVRTNQSQFILRHRITWVTMTTTNRPSSLKDNNINNSHDDDDDNGKEMNDMKAVPKRSRFRCTTSQNAKGFTDAAKILSCHVDSNNDTKQKNDDDDNDDDDEMPVLPWVGYGTYKLGRGNVRRCTLEAIRVGYRCIDTAFIYGNETTEGQVGLAIQDAIKEKLIQRKDIVVITKHWRNYHGYDATKECLKLSLQRLQLDYIDIWLMHWPGPSWDTTKTETITTADVPAAGKKKEEEDNIGQDKDSERWKYATYSKEDMPYIRSETWRAMEDSMKEGKVKSIGVSNFSIQHLQRLKVGATIWPPCINQIECHPLYSQTDLVQYCHNEGIIVQAYASLGGQDVGKKFWKKLYDNRYENGNGKVKVTNLMNTPPVMEVARQIQKTSAQVLLRWGLENGMAIIPKSTTIERMIENSNIFDFSLSVSQLNYMNVQLSNLLTTTTTSTTAQASTVDDDVDVKSMGRLCWRRDPLRLLDFD